MSGFAGRHAIVLAAVLLIAACTETKPPPELRTSIPLETATPAPPPSPVKPPAPPRKEKETVEEEKAKHDIATQGIDRLIGLNESEIQSILGPPMLQEDRAPTKLWVFRSRNCTINVTLYPDVETREFHALSYEVISDVHTVERTRQCIAQFAARFSER
jgi:hypothetical protein